MKKKKRKDKLRYKNKIRKKQLAQAFYEKLLTEEAGISEETAKRLQEKVNEMTGVERDMVRDSTLEKMSDIILDYAAPILDVIDTEAMEEYEKAIGLAITFWNCSLMEEKPGGHEEVQRLLKPLMMNSGGKDFVNHMLERKRYMYPDSKRVIMDFELSKTIGGFHLAVASTVDDEYQAKHQPL